MSLHGKTEGRVQWLLSLIYRISFVLLSCGWNCCVTCSQVIHKHFYLKRTEIMCQCEEWIADIQQYSSDKRVGRTMSHHAAALKVTSVKKPYFSYFQVHIIVLGVYWNGFTCIYMLKKHLFFSYCTLLQRLFSRSEMFIFSSCLSKPPSQKG